MLGSWQLQVMPDQQLEKSANFDHSSAKWLQSGHPQRRHMLRLIKSLDMFDFVTMSSSLRKLYESVKYTRMEDEVKGLLQDILMVRKT